MESINIPDAAGLSFGEDDLIQSICRESFYEFLKEFWDILIPEEPVWNWHIEFLCNELQDVAERVFNREEKLHDLAINIPPGTTKSTICSIFYHAWIWTRMPEARIIAGSYEHPLALTFARKARDVIESEKYRRVFRFKTKKVRTKSGKLKDKWVPCSCDDPEGVPIEMHESANAVGMYENTMKGDRKSVSQGGNVTGTHSHFIIVDDPLNPKEAVSEAGLRDANRWMDETLPSRKVDKRVTPTILIMQRLHEDDPTGHWLAKKRQKLRHICLPAEVSSMVKPTYLRTKYVDGLLDPVRLNKDVLKEQELDLGPYGYAGQYEQNPVPAGGGMFKVDKIQFDHAPNEIDFEEIVRYWDNAATKGAGCNSVGLKMGRQRMTEKLCRYWILDVVAGQWDSGQRERNKQETAERDGQNIIIGLEQEPGSGGKEQAENTVSGLAGHRIRLNRPVGDKVLRADPFSVLVNTGMVWVPIEAKESWWPALRDELKFFPFGKLKDRVDAGSGAVSLLTQKRKRAGVGF